MFKKILLPIVFFALPLLVKSQAIGDSIFIYIENRVEMKIAIPDFDQLREDSKIATDLEKFQRYFTMLDTPFNPKEAELIVYSPDSIISVGKVEKKNIFHIQDNGPINTGIRDKVIINNKKAKISITSSDLNNLKEVQLKDCFQKMVALLPKKTRFSKSFYFQCKDGNVSLLEDKTTTNSQLDAIELTASAGAGLYKNQWIGDFNFRLGISLNKKGETNYFTYLTANLLYDFPSSNRTNINTFLSLGYQWNLESTTMGAEFGYLISRQGNLFKENTFRFGLNWSPANAISVSPQVYFSDGFKQITPGIRVGFGF